MRAFLVPFYEMSRVDGQTDKRMPGETRSEKEKKSRLSFENLPIIKLSFIFRPELKMKLVRDKPTKSFHPSSCPLLSRLSFVVSAPSFSTFFPQSPSSHRGEHLEPPLSLLIPLVSFLFPGFQGEEERSNDTFSPPIRFVFHTPFHPLAK